MLAHCQENEFVDRRIIDELILLVKLLDGLFLGYVNQIIALQLLQKIVHPKRHRGSIISFSLNYTISKTRNCCDLSDQNFEIYWQNMYFISNTGVIGYP